MVKQRSSENFGFKIHLHFKPSHHSILYFFKKVIQKFETTKQVCKCNAFYCQCSEGKKIYINCFIICNPEYASCRVEFTVFQGYVSNYECQKSMIFEISGHKVNHFEKENLLTFLQKGTFYFIHVPSYFVNYIWTKFVQKLSVDSI